MGGQHAGMTRPFFFAVLSSSHVCPWLLLAPLQRLSISKIPRPACRPFSFGMTMLAMRILVIEDDREAADYLVKAFARPARRRPRRRRRDGLRAWRAKATTTCWSSTACCRKPRRPLASSRALRAQGERHAGADPVGARRGRRPGDRPARRRRRLSDQALCLLRAARPRRGAGPPRAAPAESEPTVYRVGDLELDRLSHG